MPMHYKRITSGFADDGTAQLVIPNFIHSPRLFFGYLNDIQNMDPGIGMSFIIEDGIITPTHTRNFLLIPISDPIPDNFVKCIGVINWRPRTGAFVCVEMPVTTPAVVETVAEPVEPLSVAQRGSISAAEAVEH
jgi:hypothetical protein